jgi:predicted TIM-barrel fold metal-dependent hydrolase
MVHPGLMPGEAPPPAYADTSILRASALNLQASIAQMGLTLVMSPLLERYPGVTVQLVNLGGTLPFILERIAAVARSRETPFPAERLRRMVYDTASLGPRAIETAARVLGADCLMLGTDYPIFRPAAPLDTIDETSLDELQRTMIRQGTAAALLRRLGVIA